MNGPIGAATRASHGSGDGNGRGNVLETRLNGCDGGYINIEKGKHIGKGGGSFTITTIMEYLICLMNKIGALEPQDWGTKGWHLARILRYARG